MAGFFRNSFGDEFADAPSYVNCREQARACCTSERSGIACFTVMADVADEGQQKHIGERLASLDKDDYVVCKKIWDEASLRVRADRQILANALGVDASDLFFYRSVMRLKLKRPAAPSYVLQTFQSEMRLRWGSQPHLQEYLAPHMKVLLGADSVSLRSALEVSCVSVFSSKLRSTFDRIKWDILVVWPDNLEANKLLLHSIGIAIDEGGLLFEAFCAVHTFNHGLDVFGNLSPHYSLASCLSLGLNVANVLECCRELLRGQLEIWHGLPDPQHERLRKLLLGYTLLRGKKVRAYVIQTKDGPWDVVAAEWGLRI